MASKHQKNQQARAAAAKAAAARRASKPTGAPAAGSVTQPKPGDKTKRRRDPLWGLLVVVVVIGAAIGLVASTGGSDGDGPRRTAPDRLGSRIPDGFRRVTVAVNVCGEEREAPATFNLDTGTHIHPGLLAVAPAELDGGADGSMTVAGFLAAASLAVTDEGLVDQIGRRTVPLVCDGAPAEVLVGIWDDPLVESGAADRVVPVAEFDEVAFDADVAVVVAVTSSGEVPLPVEAVANAAVQFHSEG